MFVVYLHKTDLPKYSTSLYSISSYLQYTYVLTKEYNHFSWKLHIPHFYINLNGLTQPSVLSVRHLVFSKEINHAISLAPVPVIISAKEVKTQGTCLFFHLGMRPI